MIVILVQISELYGNYLTHNISVVSLEDNEDENPLCIRKHLQVCVCVCVCVFQFGCHAI